MKTIASPRLAALLCVGLGLSGVAAAQPGIKLPKDVGRSIGGPGAPGAAPEDKQSDSPELMDGADLQVIVEQIQDLGYQARVVKLSDGAPAIDSSSSGIKFRINLYSCLQDKPTCTIDFGASWLTSKNPIALERLNEWNKSYRFAKAYNDSAGDLTLKMYMTLTHGVTKENFRANFERWVSVLSDFNLFRQGKL